MVCFLVLISLLPCGGLALVRCFFAQVVKRANRLCLRCVQRAQSSRSLPSFVPTQGRPTPVLVLETDPSPVDGPSRALHSRTSTFFVLHGVLIHPLHSFL